MSKLLIDEPPLQVLPSLAKAIGINEAIILQQIHYWVAQKRHFYDGRYWTYNTYEDWQAQFSYLSVDGIRKIIRKLAKMGLLLENNYNKSKFVHTKWYSIDYDVLDSYVENAPIDAVNFTTSEAVNFTTSITKNTKTTTPLIGEFKNVQLREVDKQTLIDKYGKDLTDRSIDFLSAQLKSNAKYRREHHDHYAMLHKWVIGAVLEKNPPRVLTKEQITNCEKKYSRIRSSYDYDRANELWRLK